jgi:hypothetical protein
VSSVAHIGTGQYEVTFSANVAACAYVATTIASGSQALLVFTAGGHLSADGAGCVACCARCRRHEMPGRLTCIRHCHDNSVRAPLFVHPRISSFGRRAACGCRGDAGTSDLLRGSNGPISRDLYAP